MNNLVLRVGDTVRLVDGTIAVVSLVDTETDFMYCYEGRAVVNGFARVYSWTRSGKYYDDDYPNGRDILEVVQGGQVA